MASNGPGIHGRHMSVEDSVGGSVPFVFSYHTLAATSDYVVVAARDFSIEVIDAWVVPWAAAGGGTVQLFNNTTAITDAMVAAVDTTVVHASTISDASRTITKDQELKITTTNAATADVYVLCRRVD